MLVVANQQLVLRLTESPEPPKFGGRGEALQDRGGLTRVNLYCGISGDAGDCVQVG